MKYTEAKSLHKGDKVFVRKTKQVLMIVEIETLSPEESANGIPGVSVRLDDGNWYGYKEIA